MARRPRSRAALLTVATGLAALTLVASSVPAAAAAPPMWRPGVAVNVSGAIDASSGVVAPARVVYAGLQPRDVPDRRPGRPRQAVVHVFRVVWPTGQTTEYLVDAELGGRVTARRVADRSIAALGRTPSCLRRDISEVVVHAGDEPFGGGGGRLLLYADRELGATFDEIVVHEAAHTLGQRIGSSKAWLAAQRADIAADPAGLGFVSAYARDHPGREDVSESFLAWLVLRWRGHRLDTEQRRYIVDRMPNRLAYFDRMGCNVAPVAAKR